MNRDTICVQGGYTPGNGEPRQIPIIQSTTFKYEMCIRDSSNTPQMYCIVSGPPERCDSSNNR